MLNGALPPRVAVRYALEIARGLVAAHQLGVEHRDLKPENIFITRDERVKILDFGLAKCHNETLGLRDSSISTGPGTILGTVGYMSPEQVRGLPADYRSDIFSLGVILYEMLAGTLPFRGDSAVETLNAILQRGAAAPAPSGSTGHWRPPAEGSQADRSCRVHHPMANAESDGYVNSRFVSYGSPRLD
jgi:eukaryotic-like serine/threonine-protein kinase